MPFEAAVLKEHGVTFVVVMVQKHIIDRKVLAGQTRRKLKRLFRRLPVVLVAQDEDGVPMFIGRQDLVRFMRKVDLKDVPWKLYSIEQPDE